ncbi:NAD(P)H-hydrate dehydratase [Marinobacter sp. F3R11]|uniref:NAD(P)H-hydrate dehydratase n=1 Tax=Marinobacter sp. F3R11 TaxID=2267231 RepID=UPI000DE8D174|nr:NAD(P)H-hydrate dehydratase [Marinobacter sp. F3R11]RBW48370.1 bifunctional ADP-dependent NAD(P)H-hydrate dehydratase/NAD(P)H-hydrate epimerase [Marinobacter sp. F3R11]
MPPHAGGSLSDALFSADSVRRIDQYIIERQGVDGFELMQAAARAAFRRLVGHWPEVERLLVLCGAGNNGGDGYLVAAKAVSQGLTVRCIAVAPTERLGGDARKAWQKAVADGVEVQELADLDEPGLASVFESAELIVDAMLGTGVSGAPKEPFASVISRCNRSGLPVLAVDLPSGLNVTSGAAEGEVIQAALTVTFIGRKLGLYTGQGAAVCGDVIVETLNADAGVVESGERPIAMLQRWNSVKKLLPARAANAHKGRFGHVLVVAGDRGFGGAGILAAEAAVRSGAGLVSLATRPEHVTAALARCPSVMVQGLIHGSELPAMLDSATVIVCGPGLGRNAWGQQMLQQVVESGKPRVLDADALNLLSSRVTTCASTQILTPHPGEAARLLGCTVPEIEVDRIAAANKLQSLYGGVVLLKGAGTVIASGMDVVDIAGGSNPGMATGGMGDVLSGIIGALYAQMIDTPAHAATIGAVVHLEAACRASADKGHMGLIPTDVIDALPQVFKEAEPGGACSWEDG